MTANLDQLRVRFMAAQLSGNRREAVRLVVEEGLASGVRVTDLQRHVVQAAQSQIGAMWQRNEVSIAQEHMATAISQLTLAALFERSRSSAPVGKKIVIACVDGELHDLPARLVADFLDLAGFDVRYLGASVPHDDLISTVKSEVPDAVGLSVTMSFNVPAARLAVARRRAPSRDRHEVDLHRRSRDRVVARPRRGARSRHRRCGSRRADRDRTRAHGARRGSRVSEELIARLTEAGPRLTDAVLGVMYQNPFWHERFGDRAKAHGRNDGLFHVRYVSQAIEANDATVIENYARWLQQVLTSRGMCTHHLAENFDLLAAAIAKEGWPDHMRAVDMLAAATQALHYPTGAAHELMHHAGRVFSATASPLGEALVGELLSYLADSLALGSPKTFVDHVVWLASFFERRSIPRAHLVDTLTALDAAITVQLPSIAPTTSATLELARGALAA